MDGEERQIFSREDLSELARFELARDGARSDGSQVRYAGDPSWRILLELYCMEVGRHKIQSTYLISQSGLSHATGTRWLSLLRDAGLITRQRIEGDQRSKFVELTPEGYRKVENYLEAIRLLIRSLELDT